MRLLWWRRPASLDIWVKLSCGCPPFRQSAITFSELMLAPCPYCKAYRSVMEQSTGWV